MCEVQIQVSARHVHLSKEDLQQLFGENYELKVRKKIGFGFAAEERLKLIGPKGKIENVTILGPCRKKTQIELAKTDARKLGIESVLRMSGDVDGTPGLKLVTESGNELEVTQGAIIAKRHIHIPKSRAQELNIADHQNVQVRVSTDFGRALTFDDVECRVIEDGKPFVMHIDTDEANAAGIDRDTIGKLVL